MKCIHILVQKNYCWIWIAVDRLGRKFIECMLGGRGAATGQALWDKIKGKDIGHVMTDYWQPYEHFVPPEKHTQSKAETFTVEGYNSIFRHYLARLRRKSKCYSKSQDMLRYSVLLIMAKWNNTLPILN